MKCRRVRDVIGAYLYGDLAPDEMKEIRLHTNECAACRQDLFERGRVTSTLPDDVPQLDDLDRQQIMWSVKGAVRARQEARRPLFGLVPALALTSVLVVGVGIGAFLGARSVKPPPGPGTQLAGREEASRARVTVTQRAPNTPPHKSPEPARRDQTASEPSDTRDRGSRSLLDPLTWLPAAVSAPTHRGNPNPDRQPTIEPEAPVPVVGEKEHGAGVNEENKRLPVPGEPEDTHKAPVRSDH